MNRGDTAYLLLNYTLNGEPLVEGAYQEIELQINKESNVHKLKKTLSDGGIQWGTVSYELDGTEQTFTGYYASLSQSETFGLDDGECKVQLRVMVNDEVGSSAISTITLGQVLSKSVLSDSTE